ncbi:MAG: cupredoxin family copper-binding protein [Candidatus Bipolaricaulota bacterium]|nr:cupredoxin family copper-binding protein [Candidatus Bipolaricaulota bacterium]MDW8140672.1 cupredoxin family copper-binding protein [Candidatus Bipolaricaulota bacterium]
MRLVRVCLVGAVVVALSGLGIAPLGQSSGTSVVDVNIQSSSFTPQNITVALGTTVRWTNRDSIAHTVTSTAGVFDSGTMNRGATFTHTFNTPGEFPYICALHPSMTGRVTVAVGVALIHSLKENAIYPPTIELKLGQPVQLFNTAADGVHPGVAISSDEEGRTPVFGVRPFNVEVGRVTTVEFTPDRVGTFFVTHRPHGHNIVGRIVVKN